jgi:transposase
MSAERLSMRKLREVLRLHYEQRLAGRAIARSLSASPSTVSGYLGRAKVAGLTWPLPPELDDETALVRRLFPDQGQPKGCRPEPDWARIHVELRKKHVTKQLLWEEYKTAQPEGYQYSQFCERYAGWAGRIVVSMRQVHRAGEKMFLDFSGDGIDIVDPRTGECRTAKLFVAVLGASSFTYVEPALSEDLESWVGGHVRALEYFGGVPEIWIPDNLKSGVTSPDRYEPDLNPTYAELARHYGAAVMPARVRKPKDKAKVEVAVQVAERWILAALRHQKFFSLSELAQAVVPLVAKINDRRMRHLGKSRRQLFEELERAVLKPLPSMPYELARWARPKLHVDYHVEYEHHFYSAPYQLVGKQLDLRATTTIVEIFFAGRRVASHRKSRERGRHTTDPAHMPKAHQAQAEWTPVRLVSWASKTGPNTAALVEEILQRRVHPQQGFRACLGLLSLGRRYDNVRLEAACARALRARACSYKSVAAILKNGLDREPWPEPPAQASLPLHENVRGRDYYH